MNLSHLWLRDFVKHGLTPAEVAHELTFRACPVESLDPLPDGDARIGLEVTFNRPDLLSHVGVAREIACATGLMVEVPDPRPAEDADCPVERCASVAVEAPDLCPRYTARVIRGVTIRESPPSLRARLEAVGVRPVNNVVDVTNYVLYELGQPLHAFDLALLADRRIVVRRAGAGEEFTAIDRSRHALSPETLVIADGRRPVAIAGVMGGLDTEISERTRDVLLESAYFDPISVRRTARRLGLRSDSSYRFERGVDPDMVERASRRAAAMILAVAGGTLCAGVIDADAKTAPGPRKLTLRLARLRAIAGIEISRKQAAGLLSRLGFGVIETEETLEVTVPPGRSEVSREIDLIEEVLRTHGYDQVPLNPAIPIMLAPVTKRERAIDRVKTLLAGAGYRETLTLSFVERDDLIDPPIFSDAPPLTVRNPVRPETPALRRSLFGSLLKAKKANLDKGNRRVKLFETGLAYLPVANAQPHEQLEVAILGDQTFLEAKGVLEALFRDLRLEARVLFAPGGASWLDPLEQAEVSLDGKRAGVLGKVGRGPADRVDLGRDRPVVAVLDLDLLLGAAEAAGGLERRHLELPQFPAVTRDLAIVVDSTRAWSEIEEVVAGAARGIEHLRRFEYIQGSVFEGGEGKPIPKGKKSIAVTLEFRADDRTLTGDEADRGRERVKVALAERLTATFRE